MADVQAIRRIIVIGSPAAGKSEAARRLGLLTKLPVHHLDALYWRPGWVEQNEERWAARLGMLTAEEQWIIDGNFIGSLPARLARADVVLWLDYSREETIKRVLSRMLLPQPMPRADLAEGCVESFDFDVLMAAWRYADTERKSLEAALRAHESSRILIQVERPKDLNYFLRRYSERLKMK